MKKLIVLILLLPFLAKSQQAVDTIKLPVRVAKEIAIELNKCDSVTEMLASVEAELMYTQHEGNKKDTLLANAQLKLANADKQIANEREQATTYKNAYTDVRRSYDRLQGKYRRHRALRNVIDVVAGIVVAVVVIILAK